MSTSWVVLRLQMYMTSPDLQYSGVLGWGWLGCPVPIILQENEKSWGLPYPEMSYSESSSSSLQFPLLVNFGIFQLLTLCILFWIVDLSFSLFYVSSVTVWWLEWRKWEEEWVGDAGRMNPKRQAPLFSYYSVTDNKPTRVMSNTATLGENSRPSPSLLA